jgi:hypothetical protein
VAEKLGLFNQLLFGNLAERATINRNAEELSQVGDNIAALRKVAERQAEEILQLRAMVMGMVEVLQQKSVIDRVQLEDAMEAAWSKLKPPPPQPPPSGDPYRGTAGDASAEEVVAAKALLAAAQDHHFSRRFPEARAVYQQIVEQYGSTKQAATAREQLKNLKTA